LGINYYLIIIENVPDSLRFANRAARYGFINFLSDKVTRGVFEKHRLKKKEVSVFTAGFLF